MAEAALDIREGVDAETVATVQGMGAYKYGWDTDIEMEYAPKGVSEEIVRLISAKNGEPEWMTEWRLTAFRRWQGMEEPRWAMVDYPKIDYQEQYYYARPRSMAEKPKSLDEVDPKLLATYEKLGIPLKEQAVLAGVQGAPRVAVDAVFDSVSVVTTFKEELSKAGVIFMPISEALREHPELVRQYLAIEQARFPDRLRPEFDVEAGVLAAAIPSFALQHLVENAIRHGVAKRTGAGAVVPRSRLHATSRRTSIRGSGGIGPIIAAYERAGGLRCCDSLWPGEGVGVGWITCAR